MSAIEEYLYLPVRINKAVTNSPIGKCEPINTNFKFKKEHDTHIQVPIITLTGRYTRMLNEEEVPKEAVLNLVLIVPT